MEIHHTIPEGKACICPSCGLTIITNEETNSVYHAIPACEWYTITAMINHSLTEIVNRWTLSESKKYYYSMKRNEILN